MKITYTIKIKLSPWLAIFAPFIAFFFACWMNIKFLYKNLT